MGESVSDFCRAKIRLGEFKNVYSIFILLCVAFLSMVIMLLALVRPNRICFLCLTETDLSQLRVVWCNQSKSKLKPRLGCYSRPPETEINWSRSNTM